MGTVLILLVAALAEGIYFNESLSQQPNNLTTIVSQLISPTTITRTLASTLTSTQTLFTSGSVTSQQTVTVTSTTPGFKTGLFFNTTLIIIPKGVAHNQSENFVPTSVKVKIGVNNSVTWINQDNLSQHTVVMNVVPSGGSQVDLILGTNETYTVKFTVPGVYQYYCMWHPNWMKGTITVLSG